MKTKVINVSLVGGAYRKGRYYSGFANATLSNGKIIYVPEEFSKGFKYVLKYVKDNNLADTEEYNERLNEWVKSGIMPPQKD
jgi:hypothetical protein